MLGLYSIKSPSGKIYIGQSVNIKRRWDDHRRKGGNRQFKLHASLNKYGYDNHIFEVLCELPIDVGVDVLNEYEQFYISQYKSVGIELLNLMGGGGALGKHSQETKDRLRDINKGKIPWHKGKTGVYTEETKKRISDTLKGRERPQHVKDVLLKNVIGNSFRLGKIHSDETKLKISNTKKGNSPAWNKNKAWSQEIKDKMHKFPKGHIPHNKGKEHKFQTEESRKKISEAHKLHWAYRKENNISISASGENCKHSKLTEKKVLEIREKLKSGISQGKIAKEYGVRQTSISAIKNRKTWKHI